MKILLLNLGYCSGLDGSMHDYVFHGPRYLHTPARIAAAVENAVMQLVRTEEPDICCFLEMHKKSALVKDLRDYPHRDVEDKYGMKSLLRHPPFFHDNCNGFFARTDVPYAKRFFRKGAKKLIYELQIGNDATLLMCHFSLSEKIRAKQFREIEAIIGERKKIILCGDFNIFHGAHEIQELMSVCNLTAIRHQPTFPAMHPKRTLDLFLCTPDIRITRCETVQSFHGSDHLPVVLEFQV